MSIDAAILRIERQWAQWPGWFGELEREAQVRLLALDRVERGA